MSGKYRLEADFITPDAHSKPGAETRKVSALTRRQSMAAGRRHLGIAEDGAPCVPKATWIGETRSRAPDSRYGNATEGAPVAVELRAPPDRNFVPAIGGHLTFCSTGTNLDGDTKNDRPSASVPLLHSGSPSPRSQQRVEAQRAA